MIDESGLLEAARRGDPEALGQIFDIYASAIFRYAMRLCHDIAEADRTVGDVFAQLLEQLSAGQGPRTNLRSYLYQIAYHVLVDHIREGSHVSSIDDVLSQPDGTASVPRQVEEREILKEIEYAVMHELTDEQRHVILLRFVEGFSLQETASITGRNVNAVSVLQNRAVTKLREVLGVKFGSEE